jgi:hypothetical protein
MMNALLPIDYSKTPTPLPPPPRRVHGGFVKMRSLWFARLFCLPHSLVGIGMFGYWFFLLSWLLFGWNLPGKLVGIAITHSKGGIRYELRFQYKVEERVTTEVEDVSEDIYNHFSGFELRRPLKNDVTIHYFAFGPLHYAGLCEAGSTWSRLGLLTIGVVFWNGLMSLFVYEIWIKPLRVRSLYKRGQAITGTLVSTRRAGSGHVPLGYASYEFEDPVSKQGVKCEMGIWNKKVLDTVAPPKTVTILYDQSRPKRSAVYELGGYTVDFAGGTGAVV